MIDGGGWQVERGQSELATHYFLLSTFHFPPSNDEDNAADGYF
jgi:hypothetical protein